MTPLTNTSLSADERRVLERFVEALRGELGDDLCSVWLYGSRARGEPPHPGSDVDVLVIIRQSDWFQDVGRVNGVLWAAAQAEDVEPYRFSAHVGDIEGGGTAGDSLLLHSRGRPRQDRSRGRRMSPRSEEFMTEAHACLRGARVQIAADLPSRSVGESYYATLYAARAALSEVDRYATPRLG